MNLGHCRPPSPYVTGYSINEFLSNETHIDVNERLAKLMNSVKEKLKGETGIEDNDIYQVPVVFERGICWGPDDGVNPERNCSSKPINVPVLSGNEYLAPDPWGPVINGVDIMKQRISNGYQRNQYHGWGRDSLWDKFHSGCAAALVKGEGKWKGMTSPAEVTSELTTEDAKGDPLRFIVFSLYRILEP
ncbi:hypothetical protein F9C07_2098887 [Aspergillus flavus]|uniref:Protein-arginine deiminase C-terminal domain-containing protein n=1 Tax=Aspergillus flavus (strain ATCC 200026 / FGSC A1120 / IAM 13836 / NRRL 3357 / JCM 12722 / SRRC 167) TaxID=332952 RepID=A0A7U2MCG8_ASPFN|nr:hypothetical protein F9C07_2098887 [Aspergillus flavus]